MDIITCLQKTSAPVPDIHADASGKPLVPIHPAMQESSEYIALIDSEFAMKSTTRPFAMSRTLGGKRFRSNRQNLRTTGQFVHNLGVAPDDDDSPELRALRA
ncbi:hypothetical protein [Azohydromonas aeria]|uniref:hypothetical protein n=1 Tax=Azohydromonas aeria TaxID=2590212 RepID=UPI0012FC5DB6|nr:hypothetical protein [Azohydromonas aeria]